jgi:hypothetical protein
LVFHERRVTSWMLLLGHVRPIAVLFWRSFL